MLHVAPTVSVADGISLAVVAMLRALSEETSLGVQLLVGEYRRLPLHPALSRHSSASVQILPVFQPLGGRLGFTAWKPNPKLGELYRSFTEEPLEGRESTEWGREDHVEDMLGEEFELEFEDGTLWLEADSGEEIWKLFSESAPPVLALLRTFDAERREAFHEAFVDFYEGYRTDEGEIRAPRRYLLVVGRRKPAAHD